MAGTNVVVISGRVGKEPEIRSTSTGKSVGKFSIASEVGYGDRKHCNWWDVEVWDKTAEAVGRLVTKGARVVVTGQLDNEPWEGQDGQKKSRVKIRANTVDIIDFPPKDDDDPNAPF